MCKLTTFSDSLCVCVQVSELTSPATQMTSTSPAKQMTSTTPSSSSSSKNVSALGYSRFRPKNFSTNIDGDNDNDYNNNEIEAKPQKTRQRRKRRRSEKETSKYLRLKAARNRYRETHKFTHRRVRKLPCPVVIMHSPPLALTANDHQTCASNWKNDKGFAIPLIRRSSSTNIVDPYHVH